MKEFTVINKVMYEKTLKGYSVFSGDPVVVIGEQTVVSDGRILDQYLYNIVGYTTSNGMPFVSLKCNIILA